MQYLFLNYAIFIPELYPMQYLFHARLLACMPFMLPSNSLKKIGTPDTLLKDFFRLASVSQPPSLSLWFFYLLLSYNCSLSSCLLFLHIF